MRKLKCYGWCDQKHPKDEMKQFSGKNYCEDCYRRKVRDDDGRKTLLGVISKVYDIPFANGQMLRQMKTFREEKNYEYEDVAKAVLYAKYILNKNMQVKFGLGLVPYVIEDAKAYYKDQQDRVENMKNKRVPTENNKVKAQFKKYDKNEKKNEKMINMEDILL